MATRKEVAIGLRKAANSYWSKKGYSCHNELGVARWGKFKADVIAINLRCDIVLVELKSCVTDFNVDDRKGKWLNYLDACHRFYFCFTEETHAALEQHFLRFRQLGCGVLVLDKATGYLRVALSAKRRTMPKGMQKEICTRMAWRNGDCSKRTNRNRVRVFLD